MPSSRAGELDGGGGKVLGVQISSAPLVVQLALRCHGLWLFYCLAAVFDFRFVPVFSFGSDRLRSVRISDRCHVGRFISMLPTVRSLLGAWGVLDGVLKAFNRVTKPFGCMCSCNP